MKYIDEHGNISHQIIIAATKPISERRVDVIESLACQMRLKAQEKEEQGYKNDWRDKDFDELLDCMKEEIAELKEAMFYIEKFENPHSNQFKEARRECADIAFYVAMIHDQIASMEEKA